MNPKPEAEAPSGHLPTLIACFMHFDLSFMLWVLLGALGVFAAEETGLSAAPWMRSQWAGLAHTTT